MKLQIETDAAGAPVAGEHMAVALVGQEHREKGMLAALATIPQQVLMEEVAVVVLEEPEEARLIQLLPEMVEQELHMGRLQ
jgi:hypothetical protein